jgi:hypothetical protein
LAIDKLSYATTLQYYDRDSVAFIDGEDDRGWEFVNNQWDSYGNGEWLHKGKFFMRALPAEGCPKDWKSQI